MVRIKIIYSLVFLLTSYSGFTQNTAAIDSSYNNWYYQQRMDLYEKLEVKKHDIVFLGNSITEKGGWHEMLPGKMVANRGIGGDNTFGILARLKNIISLQPEKIFILIGINDLGRGLPIEVIAQNYSKILSSLKEALPDSRIYIQSILPLNEDVLKYDYLKGKMAAIKYLNDRLEHLAEKEYLTFIDLHPLFADDKGQLKKEWTSDGIHLRPVAYSYWVEYLKEWDFL